MSKVHKLPSLLRFYSESNYVTQQRANFLFYLCVALLFTVLLLISLRLYFHPLSNFHDPSHITNLLPLALIFILFIFCLFLLIKGYYKASSIILPITILGVIWFIMFNDENQIIARLNTVVYVFMVLSMLPLLIQKRNYIILLTTAVNIVIVIGFTVFFKSKLNLTKVDFWDYIIDNSISFAFVGFVGFYMNKIYSSAIEQAQTDLQKRIETEKSLVESESKYREITESLPQIIFEIDLSRRITYINQIGLKKFGYSSDEIKNNMLVTDFIVEKETLLQNIEKNIKGEIKTFRYTAIQKDGKNFPIQVYSSLILKKGQPDGLRGIAIDLSDELKTQKAIRETEERFSAAFKSNPAPMAISDIETGFFIDVNDKWTQIIGYSKNEHIGRTSTDLNYWFDNSDRIRIVQKLKEDGFFKDEIVAVKTKSDVTIKVKWSAEIITLNDRKVMLSLVSDETEKLQAEAALRESEERFSVSFKSSPAPLIISEIDTGEIIDANDKWIEMLGYTYSEQIGKTTKDIGIFARNNDRENLIKKIKIDGFLKDEKINFITKSGDRIIAKWSAETITLNGKKVLLSLITDETEKIKVEEEVRQSRELFKTLIESSPISITLSDLQGKIILANNVFSKYAAQPIEYIIGKSAKEIGIITDYDDQKIVLEQMQKKGYVKNFETNVFNRKGEHFFMLFSAQIVTFNGQKGILQTSIDITERHKTELELDHSQKLFKTLIDSNPNSITLIDSEGKYIMVNKSFADYLKLEPLEIIGKTPEELGIKLDISDKEIILNELFTKGFISGFETHINNEDGKNISILIFGSIVEVNNNKSILLSAVDITDRKALENKLRESETLFRLMVDMVPYSIVISDEQERFIFANQPFYKKYNLNYNTLLGKTSQEIGLKFNEQSEKAFHEEFSKQGKVLNIETNIVTPNNDTIYALISSQPVIINEKPHKITTTVDITDRKHLENELKKNNEQLEFLVKERTEKLEASNFELIATNKELYTQRAQLSETLEQLKSTHEQLIQTEKMASLGVLTAGVAHEINNPINYIYNGALAIENFLVDHSPENIETLKPLFEAINTGIHRVTGIVKSLNKYSRKDESSLVKCNLNEILDNTLTMLYNQYKKRIEITKEYSSTPPIILAKEGELHQVFLNILINAIQAIEDKGYITVRTKINDNSVSVYIKDSGIGIQSDYISKVFDPFFTTKDPGKGTGLGLSITKKIIQEHKGAINCYSEPNKGTEFIITLPQTQEV